MPSARRAPRGRPVSWVPALVAVTATTSFVRLGPGRVRAYEIVAR